MIEDEQLLAGGKEGTEAAEWLNGHGVSAFVVRYRTTSGTKIPGWVKPLQDAQRMMALVRSQAERWGLREDRIGLVGFSAGGQVAARLLEKGVYAIGFFFPVVPEGTARIRTQISAAHSREDLDFAIGVFAEVKAEFGF